MNTPTRPQIWPAPGELEPHVKKCGRTGKWVSDVDGDHLCGGSGSFTFEQAVVDWRRDYAAYKRWNPDVAVAGGCND